MDRQELVSRIRTGRTEWEAALAPVDDRRAAEPALYARWSVKDLLAHIGWWERRIVNVYRYLTEGTPLDPPLGALNEDEINDTVYNQFKDAPLAGIRDMELSAYADLLGLAESAPEAVLFDPQHYAWTQGRPFWNWLAGNSYNHYAEHLPAVVAWLSEPSAG